MDIRLNENFLNEILSEWTASLDDLIKTVGADNARQVIGQLNNHAKLCGLETFNGFNTPYANTIAAAEDSGSSISPSPTNAQTLLEFRGIISLLARYFKTNA